jgi:lipopolysaccharide export system permease protein
MRLLDRYLFRELLTPLAFCLGGILSLLVFYELFDDLEKMQERKMHLLDVLAYALSLLPGFVVLVLPVALLLALLYTLTNHSRHNELTAMRAAGVSLWRICAPYFIVGLAASLFLFALNEWGVPRSTSWANRLISRTSQKSADPETKNIFRSFGFTNTRDHRSWFISEYHVKTAEMFRPHVEWTSVDGVKHQINADHAIRTNGVWTFFNVTEYTQAGTTAPLEPAGQTNVLAMPEFDETPAQIRSEIKISAYLSLGGTFKSDIPLKDIFDYLRLHPDLSRADSARLFTKFHGRLATPWTCVVVVLIAIPFGAASGRRNLFVGVAGSIFICFTYFGVQQVSLALGGAGRLPPWLAAWLPNIIFGATGLLLTARVR